MKPIRVFSHVACEHPGYLCEHLDKRGICYEKIYIGRGEPIPKQIDDVSGLVFMGAPVSVNDPLPWIAEELALIRLASQAGIPILGICFGGQLISKALGKELLKPLVIDKLSSIISLYSKPHITIYISTHFSYMVLGSIAE